MLVMNMRTSAKMHMHAVGRRRAAASARWAAAPAPTQSFFEGMPDELRDSAAVTRWNAWMLDCRIDPESGEPLPGEDFTDDELADFAGLRAQVAAEGQFERSAARSAKVPFFALFLVGKNSDDDDGASQIIRHQPGRKESPPPPASPGGRSLPTYCLAPRLLGQRPQATRATRVALPLD
jgi:hypothetical protein